MFVRAAAAEPDLIEDMAFSTAGPEDADAYARDVGTDSPATFTARMTGRTRCFLVRHNGSIVHASWVTESAAWTREIARFVLVPPGDAYVYESYTRPEVRGRGVYPFALRKIVTWAHEQGLAKVWVAVEDLNRASIRAVTKAGFEEAFRISFRRRLGIVTIDSPSPEARGLLSGTPPPSGM